jgi:hypothetical protein
MATSIVAQLSAMIALVVGSIIHMVEPSHKNEVAYLASALGGNRASCSRVA